MKVCDRHDRTPAAYTIGLANEETWDLCNECVKDLRSWCSDAKVEIKKPSPKRKKSKSD